MNLRTTMCDFHPAKWTLEPLCVIFILQNGPYAKKNRCVQSAYYNMSSMKLYSISQLVSLLKPVERQNFASLHSGQIEYQHFIHVNLTLIPPSAGPFQGWQRGGGSDPFYLQTMQW